MSVQDMFKNPDAEPVVFPGSLRGYRSWRLTERATLQSTAWPYEWQREGNRATCATSRHAGAIITSSANYPAPAPAHSSPDKRCYCGFYGWYAPDDHRLVPSDVTGVIAASGRMVLGSHGFRAERAEIVAVTAGARWLPMLRDAGFDVYPDEAALIAAFPPDDVSGLVTHECDTACEVERVSALSWGSFHRALSSASGTSTTTFTATMAPAVGALSTAQATYLVEMLKQARDDKDTS